MDIPRPRYARRSFYAVMALACSVLLLLEFVLGPSVMGANAPTWGQILEDLFLSLLTSILSATLIGTFLIWLIPEGRHADVSDVKIVPARERGEFLETARANTDLWWFSGGMGRFNVAVTLPDLARHARRENANRSIVLIMLDPDSNSACENYSRLRLGLRSGVGADWSPKRVRLELLASILSASRWNDQEPLLEIKIALKSQVSLTRYDLSSSTVVMTTEDPHESALAFHRGSPYYRLIRENLRLELSQTRQLILASAAPLSPIATATQVRTHLNSIGLRTTDLTTVDLETIAAKVTSPENPYA